MTNPVAGDPVSWLDTIWEALDCHRENNIPEGDPAHDAQWDDICTAMAWISEEVGAPEKVDL